MRRRLVVVTLAVTSLLVAAFALPLAALVRDVARDRAITDAERDLAAIAPVLAVTTDEQLLEAAIGRTQSGAAGRMSLVLPDGTRIGDSSPADQEAISLASERRLAFSTERAGGVDVYTPVLLDRGQAAVLRVRVPASLLRDGVAASWAILGVLAVALLAISVAATDRLARTVTKPAARVAATGRALASGQSSARAEVAGPPEIAEVALALNALADRIDELRTAERERVADLSHRLRTPLTALRLSAEAQGADALVADIDRLEAEVTQLIRTARRPLHDEAVARCDLAAVAGERASFWGALADDDRRPWSISVEPASPQPVRLVEADAAAALDAVLGNVFAHTPEGAPYRVSLHREDGMVVLIVDDGGPGIDGGIAVVGRGSSPGGSTGLGLDIAASACRAAGGELRLDVSPLGGTRVVLELPVAGEVP